jgi:hypothetical protein
MLRVLVVLGAAATAWMIVRGHRDPRRWPAEAMEEWARVRGAAAEAIAAGKRAAARRETELDVELERARNGGAG